MCLSLRCAASSSHSNVCAFQATGASSFLLELHAYNLPACITAERAEAWIFAQAGIFARLQDVAGLLFFPYLGANGGGYFSSSPTTPSESLYPYHLNSAPLDLETVSGLPDGETILLRRDFFKTSYSHPHPGTNFVVVEGSPATTAGGGGAGKATQTGGGGGGGDPPPPPASSPRREEEEHQRGGPKKGGEEEEEGAQGEMSAKVDLKYQGNHLQQRSQDRGKSSKKDGEDSCRKAQKGTRRIISDTEGGGGGVWGFVSSLGRTLRRLVFLGSGEDSFDGGSGGSDEEDEAFWSGQKRRRGRIECETADDSEDGDASTTMESTSASTKRNSHTTTSTAEDRYSEGDETEEGRGGEDVGWGFLDGMSMLTAFDPRRFRAFSDPGFFVLINVERFLQAREKAVQNLLMLYPWESEYYLDGFFKHRPPPHSSAASPASSSSSSGSRKIRGNRERARGEDTAEKQMLTEVGGSLDQEKDARKREKEEDGETKQEHPRLFDRPFIPADVWIYVNEIRNRTYRFDARERIAKQIR